MIVAACNTALAGAGVNCLYRGCFMQAAVMLFCLCACPKRLTEIEDCA